MKLVILTQEESLFLAPMLEAVFRELRDHQIEVFLFADVRMPKLRKLASLSRTFGAIYTFRTGFDYLWRKGLTLAERSGVRLSRRAPSITAAARRMGIPVHAEHSRVNTTSTVAALRGAQPDLLISVACPQILKKDVLSVPARYAINVHGGPLPRYRGMHSAFWQLYHGERACATTVHVMTEGIDAGPILEQEPWSIEAGDTLHDVIARSKAAGARALIRAVRAIEAGTERTRENAAECATYFTEPNREDLLEFWRRGKALR